MTLPLPSPHHLGAPGADVSAPGLADELGKALERLIAIKMEAYPSAWSQADKREMAIQHLGLADCCAASDPPVTHDGTEG